MCTIYFRLSAVGLEVGQGSKSRTRNVVDQWIELRRRAKILVKSWHGAACMLMRVAAGLILNADLVGCGPSRAFSAWISSLSTGVKMHRSFRTIAIGGNDCRFTSNWRLPKKKRYPQTGENSLGFTNKLLSIW
jgi:hypothetical protein